MTLKIGLRQLRKDRSFLVTAGVTLALCVGANTTIFSVVNSVILRSLPVDEPHRVVTMWNAYPGATGVDARGSNAAPDYHDRRALTEVFEEVAAYDRRGRTVEIEGIPQRVRDMNVTPSFFRLLRVEAAEGRTFVEEEGEPGNERVVLLSHGLRQQLFGDDPSIAGRTLRVDGRLFEIVGVMPRNLLLLDQEIRMWTPIAYTQEQLQQYHSNSWSMIARLQPGITLVQAQAQIDALNLRNLERIPELKPLLLDAGFHTPLYGLQDALVRDVRAVLFLLWGGVAFVMLIGCVNVASLMLVCSTGRAKELAMRFALGASRRRIAQQLLTESMLLTLTGGAVGLLVASGGLRLLASVGIEQLPRSGEIRLDIAAIVFTIALASTAGALIALIPLLSVLRLSPGAAFRQQIQTSTASRALRLLRRGMVVVQVALSVVLLVGAGLLISSFWQLLAIDPGFEPQGVLTARVTLTEDRYPQEGDAQAFTERALEAIRALPGVEAAGTTSQIPFGLGFNNSVIFAEGYVMKSGESAISPAQSVVSPGYFDAMGIPVLEGRALDARDRRDGRLTILIDERLARRFWPAGDALGKRMWMPNDVEDLLDPGNAKFFDIVGIVESIHMQGLSNASDAMGACYLPLSQAERLDLDFAIRTSGDPRSLIGAVRGAIATVDSQLPLFDIRSMQERIDQSLTDRRTPTLLASGFGAAALLLVALGTYGVLAHLVQLRTREIGIRMALGSEARKISTLVVQESLAILMPGLAVGFLGALGIRRLIQSQLYSVSALDPTVLVGTMVLLSVVALLACLTPARRATRIDPVVALTQE